MSATPLTPAGLQSARTLAARRAVVVVLNLATYGALVAALAHVLGAGGWTAVDVVLFAAFLLGAPWTVLGFWNAVLGLWLLHGVRDGLKRVAPYAAAGETDTPLHLDIAVLMTLRNEDPSRALRRMRVMKASLDRTGAGARFAYFILSDTSDPAIAAREESEVRAWQDDAPGARIVYRRRDINTGFKAGNLRDFCARWGRDFDLMLPLDADSLMTGDAVVTLARMMQAYPRLGILQSLVVGLPSASAFARMFQFGMRQGMRSYTTGAAWWTGDCGPFWGHNALVRIAPFYEHCDLPVLPGKPPLGGHILSHDQIEAVLMRRAGYEVRVLPMEGGSWEENPPSALDFMQRDQRWCQGNMQYWRLLGLPGLAAVSRFQLVWAISMFIGVPAWLLMIALLPLKVFDSDVAAFPAAFAAALYVVFQLMYLAPKLAGLIDVLLTPGGLARYGGGLRFAAGAAVELVFSYLLSALTTLATGVFMVALLFGTSIRWSAQARDVAGLSWAAALRRLWWHEAFGAVVAGILWAAAPAVLVWSLPLTAGYALAVPFAVVTAAPRVGGWFARAGLNGIPEDFDPPRELRELRALETAR